MFTETRCMQTPRTQGLVAVDKHAKKWSQHTHRDGSE